MNHRKGMHTTSINILPGQPGWRSYLQAFTPGAERDAERKRGYETLEAQKNAGGQKSASAPSGLGDGPK